VSEILDHSVTSQTPPLPSKDMRAVDDRTRLLKLLAKQLRNCTVLFARTLAEENADTVHDLRVCTRRLQQMLAALAPEKNLHKARSVRRTLRRIRRALGPWRNCDVALQWSLRCERRSSKPVRKNAWKLVRESIAAERGRAIERARHRLYKSGGIMLNHRIQQLLALPADRRGCPDSGVVVRQAVGEAAARWHVALATAKAERSVQHIHGLRIQAKRLRYCIEMARDLGSAEAPALIAWFKMLQDRLGHWHDRQELSRFIARALTRSDVLITEPALAMELLREVERGNRISTREIDELFHIATESDGARLLDAWVQSYSSSAETAASAPPPDGASIAASQQPQSMPAHDAPATAQPSDQQSESPESDGEVQN
jgi:CHAD domain-containing protein